MAPAGASGVLALPTVDRHSAFALELSHEPKTPLYVRGGCALTHVAGVNTKIITGRHKRKHNVKNCKHKAQTRKHSDYGSLRFRMIQGRKLETTVATAIRIQSRTGFTIHDRAK